MTVYQPFLEGTEPLQDARGEWLSIHPRTTCEVVEIPSKGSGLVARHNLARGTRILVESPLLLLPDGAASRCLDELKCTLQELFNAMSPENRQSFLSLSCGCRVPCMMDLAGIFKINKLSCGSGSGLFPSASRINHSCLPNAEAVWNEEKGWLTVHAITDIPEGTEITRAYVEGSFQERSVFLHSEYDFVCDCWICSCPQVEIAASDSRRRTIRGLEEELRLPFKTCCELLTDLVTLVRHLGEEFGWPGAVPGGRLSVSFNTVHQAAACIGDHARASIFARLMYDIQYIVAGGDHPRSRKLLDLFYEAGERLV